MNVYAFLALLAFFSYLALGFFVFQLDSKRPLNRIFFFFCLASSAYSFSEFGYLQAESYETAWLWIKARAVWPFTFALALHFHLIFTRKNFWTQSPLRMGLLYFPAILIFIVDLFSTWITGTPVMKYGVWGYQPPVDSILPLLSGLYALIYTLSMVSMVLVFYIKNRKTQSLINSQAAYILGAGILVIVIVIINTFLQQIPNFAYVNVDSALLLSSNIIIAYGIWRFSISRVNKHLAYGEIVSTMSEFLFLVNPDGRISAGNELALEITGLLEDELENCYISEVFKHTTRQDDFDWFETDTEMSQEKTGTVMHASGTSVQVKFSVIKIPIHGTVSSGWAYMGNVLKQENPVYFVENISTPIKKAGKDPVNQLIKVINHDLSEGTRLIHLCTQLVEYDKLELELENELLFFAEEKTRNFINENLDRNRKHLICIQEEALLLRRRLKALGDYATADTEKARTSVDLKKMVELAFSQCIPHPEKIDLTVSIGHLPIIHAVPEQIMRLIKHLITNAIKFRKSNQSLHIEVDTVFQDIKTHIIEFRDNGIGILPDYHQRVFEIFHRLHTPAQYEGVGIGLAICKKIVASHQGEIWINAEREQGTAVCISLPTS